MVAPRAQQAPPQTFRGSVDLVAVDVEVIDRDGRPVAGLGPDKFEVTINGRKRRVVSADLVSAGSASSPLPARPGVAAAPTAAPAETAAPPVAKPGRVVILSVDCLSFGVGAVRGVIVAARTFIERLPPEDLVGLFAYPLGPKVDPTMDRAAVIRALDTIAGQRDGIEGEFHLRPADIVDLSAWADNLPGYGEDLALKACGEDVTSEEVQNCRNRLRTTVKSLEISYEGQGNASLAMLRTLLHSLAAVPGRKTMVLISAGTVASDIPGGRPDLSDTGAQVGKAAAEANVAIYTLFVDQGWLDQFSAETRRPTIGGLSVARESAVLGRWLEIFSGTAGGSMMRVAAGNGEAAFDRMLREMSAYYLLGVAPEEADRDGRAHALKVKVSQRDVTVRGRAWVVLPKRGAAPPATAVPAPDKTTPAAILTAAPPRPLPEPVGSMAAAFDKGDYAAFQRALRSAPDLAIAIGDFRAGDNPWPTVPRRTAAFALEVAMSGFASRNGFARDAAAKLLAEYLPLVRQATEAEAFECVWYWTAIAGLQGLQYADTGLAVVARARQRCASEPRFLLAEAVLIEQQQSRAPDLVQLMPLYEKAMASPETRTEARVRAAWLNYRAGKRDQAFELLGPPPAPGLPDLQLAYFYELVRGHLLRARGDSEGAAAAFQAALQIWPNAQSARVALMAVRLGRGDRQEAERLADAVLAASDTDNDPWPMFTLGDLRLYPAILADLRSRSR